MEIALSLAVIFLILVASEYLWRSNRLEPETARKIIHICVGSFIAFWPLYMSWREIQILSVVLFFGVLVSYELGVFGAIHHVKRRTSGELWYPVGIGLSALLTIQPWIFCIAILHMSLADGLAAVVGTRWGLRGKKYYIGTHTRSLLGSFTFLTISICLSMFAYIALSNELPGTSLAVFAIMPFLVTAVESISRHGLDNVFIPLSVIFALGLPTSTLVFSIIY